MTDKELADAVVAILNPHCPIEGMYYTIPSENDVTAEQFVRDWRVAGALMERMDWIRIMAPSENQIHNLSWRVIASANGKRTEIFHQLMEIAIIEACVEALSQPIEPQVLAAEISE